MNFFQKIRTGRLFSSQPRTPRGSVIPPGMIAKFVFADKTYIIEEFNISFNQELNAKGQPGGLPRGGIMTLTIPEPPGSELNEWISRDTILRDGLIRFFRNQNKTDESALWEVSFKNAYCTKYQKKIRTPKGGLFTTLIISPEYVKIGNEEFENNWKKEKPLSHYINIRSVDK